MVYPLDDHYRMAIRELTAGRVIPFLGAGVNLCGRPEHARWQQGQYLPNGGELAEHLAGYFSYPSNERSDLVRVSQYISTMTGTGALYEELRKVFHANYPPTPLHTFFAQLPSALRKKPYESPYQLIVTTNYDDVLERAFQHANEPVDVVTYLADSEENGQKGTFRHSSPRGTSQS